MFLTVSAQQTVFNPDYVKNQVSESTAAQTINQQLNLQLNQAGIQQSNLISDDLINDELETMIQQFYDGDQIQLDQTLIKNAVSKEMDTSNVIQQGIVSVVVNRIVSVFNSQLNTQKLNQYSSQVNKIKSLNQIVMWTSAAGLIGLVLVALMKRRMLSLIASSTFVIGSFVAIISAIAYATNVLSNLPIQYAVVKSIVEQVGQDVLIREFTIALIVLAVGVLFGLLAAIFNRKSRKSH